MQSTWPAADQATASWFASSRASAGRVSVLTSSPQEIESETIDALRSAVATLEAKAPEEVEAYKSFVLELAQSVGKAAGGGDEAEAATVERIHSALG